MQLLNINHQTINLVIYILLLQYTYYVTGYKTVYIKITISTDCKHESYPFSLTKYNELF